MCGLIKGSPILRNFLKRHLLFVGGKGGVGKTTTAAALALVAADQGQRCLVVSTDPAHSLGDIFDQSIGRSETLLEDRLWGLEIDPDAEAERHIQTVKSQMKRLVHARLYHEIDRQMDLAKLSPGAAEAALLERVALLMGDEGARFDLVIFDTAPSGHTVRLLSLPEVMEAWTDGLLRHRTRSTRLSSILRHIGGVNIKGDELSMIESPEEFEPGTMSAEINEVLQQRRRLFLVARERLLDNATTAFLLVLNADKLSILESRKIAGLLSRFDLDISGVVVNRVLPDDAGSQFLAARRQQEQTYLSEIEQMFHRVPRIIVPLLERDVHGLQSLRSVGELLMENS